MLSEPLGGRDCAAEEGFLAGLVRHYGVACGMTDDDVHGMRIGPSAQGLCTLVEYYRSGSRYHSQSRVFRVLLNFVTCSAFRST